MTEEQLEYEIDDGSRVEIRVDTNHIPAAVGSIGEFDNKESLKIKSMREFSEWVSGKIPNTSPARTSFVIAGPLPNCAAVQIGILLSGKGDIYFETTRKTRRKVGVV